MDIDNDTIEKIPESAEENAEPEKSKKKGKLEKRPLIVLPVNLKQENKTKKTTVKATPKTEGEVKPAKKTAVKATPKTEGEVKPVKKATVKATPKTETSVKPVKKATVKATPKTETSVKPIKKTAEKAVPKSVVSKANTKSEKSPLQQGEMTSVKSATELANPIKKPSGAKKKKTSLAEKINQNTLSIKQQEEQKIIEDAILTENDGIVRILSENPELIKNLAIAQDADVENIDIDLLIEQLSNSAFSNSIEPTTVVQGNELVDENVAVENVTEENAIKEEVTSEYVAVENGIDENVPNENVTEEEIITQETETITDEISTDLVMEEFDIEQSIAPATVQDNELIDEYVADENAIEEEVINEDVADENVNYENKAEEDVSNEYIADENVADENVSDEKADYENKAEEDVSSEYIADEYIADENVANESVTEEEIITQETETITDEISTDLVMEEFDIEQSIAPATVQDNELIDEYIADENAIEEDVSNEYIADENVADENVADEKVDYENKAEDDVSNEYIADEYIADENVADENITEENIVDENVIDEKVVEEQIVAQNVDNDDVILNIYTAAGREFESRNTDNYSNIDFSMGNDDWIPEKEYLVEKIDDSALSPTEQKAEKDFYRERVKEKVRSVPKNESDEFSEYMTEVVKTPKKETEIREQKLSTKVVETVEQDTAKVGVTMNDTKNYLMDDELAFFDFDEAISSIATPTAETRKPIEATPEVKSVPPVTAPGLGAIVNEKTKKSKLHVLFANEIVDSTKKRDVADYMALPSSVGKKEKKSAKKQHQILGYSLANGEKIYKNYIIGKYGERIDVTNKRLICVDNLGNASVDVKKVSGVSGLCDLSFSFFKFIFGLLIIAIGAALIHGGINCVDKIPLQMAENIVHILRIVIQIACFVFAAVAIIIGLVLCLKSKNKLFVMRIFTDSVTPWKTYESGKKKNSYGGDFVIPVKCKRKAKLAINELATAIIDVQEYLSEL